MQGLRAPIGSVLAAALLLLQACASAPPEMPEAMVEVTPQPAPPPVLRPVPLAPPPSVVVQAAPAPPAPVPVPQVRLRDASHLPPFEGEKQVLEQPQSVAVLDRTKPPGDVWQRLRNGFAMPDIQSPRVAGQTAWYAANQEYLKRVFDRSRLYLFHIVEELEKRGMPMEIALLPIVESAFNPMAYSRAHASGLWQFIPGTGKRYELKQNWWYDGRRDIVASTSAALDYLKDVYDLHGDWHLALASYNWGENAVGRAVAKNRREGKPTDYMSLPMPRETRGYVPKLQALKNLIANPAAHGIVLDPIPNEPYFATVDKAQDIDVKLAAKLAEIPVADFVALNPGFSRPLIRSVAGTRIVLPADKVETFHENLEKHEDRSLVSWKPYTPKRGDTLESIARQHGLTLGQLREVNGIHPRTRQVPKLLVVPIKGGAETFARLPIMYAPPIPAGGRVHVVRRGESAWGIAQRYKMTLQELRRWNQIGKILSIGQRLVIK